MTLIIILVISVDPLSGGFELDRLPFGNEQLLQNFKTSKLHGTHYNTV